MLRRVTAVFLLLALAAIQCVPAQKVSARFRSDFMIMCRLHASCAGAEGHLPALAVRAAD